MRVLKHTLILLAFTFLSAVTIFAQTATGEVRGTVGDANGAKVPGATVKLINQATNAEIEAVTSEGGYFTFPNLKPATYTLMVEAKGFKKTLTNAFTLGVSVTLTKDIALSVGEMSEVVEVTTGDE